jgi:hypothetical protein
MTLMSRWVSLAERSCSSFAPFVSLLCAGFSLSLPLLVSPLTATIGDPGFYVLDSVLEPIAGAELPKKVFRSRARWMPLQHRVSLPLKCYASVSVLSYEALLLLSLVNLKTSCNNLIYTLIMSLYASFVCLRILASSRIPRLILRWQNPHFWGGSVTVDIRARLGLNTHSKHLKMATTLMVQNV